MSHCANSCFLSRLLCFRRAIAKGLCIKSSLIPLDIILAIASHPASIGGDVAGVRVKELLNGIPHSPTGIRYHLKEMIGDGWIELRRSVADGRIRFLVLTEKALAALNETMNALETECPESCIFCGALR